MSLVQYYGAQATPSFVPPMRNILSITNANPAVVTTTFFSGANVVPGAMPHGYVSGTIVRIIIPKNFGMQQLNQFQGAITVLSTTTFSIPIDTTNFDAFAVPTAQPLNNYTSAQVVPFGELTSQLTASFVNILTPQFEPAPPPIQPDPFDQ